MPTEAPRPAASAAQPAEEILINPIWVRVLGLKNSCPAEKSHAFYEVAEHILSGRHDRAELRFESYYQDWWPESAATVLGLPEDHALGSCPPLAAVLPWMPETPDAQLAAREGAILTRGWGLGHGATDGSTRFGPASRRHVRAVVATFARTISEARSLDAREKPARLSGALIAVEGGLRAVLDMRDGFMWAAVFAALGQHSMRVQLLPGPAVQRDGVADWPHVRDGLFTEAEALRIFDQFLEGVL